MFSSGTQIRDSNSQDAVDPYGITPYGQRDPHKGRL
jgi:hypothetical protein